MFISLTIEINATEYDIRIDAKQIIIEALIILRQCGKLPVGANPDYFRSLLKQQLVSAHKTFSEEGVYDGDVLSAIF